MAADIRQVEFEDLSNWLRAMRVTYLVDPGLPITDAMVDWWRRIWDRERTWGAFEGSRCVATLRTFGTPLSVPGTPGRSCPAVAADALTQVSVQATHRRQGVLSTMLNRTLADAKQRGESVSILRAAEWPIYGRFGYSVATMVSNYTVRTVPRPEVLPPRDKVTVTGCEPAELAEIGAGLIATRATQQPGHIGRARSFWERQLGLEGLKPFHGREPVCVLARASDGTPVGYALWSAQEGDWFDERVDITLHDFIATTEDGYRALWQYLIGIDLIKSITWREGPVSEPLEWLLPDGRAARRELTMDGTWLRLLDVPEAMSARGYATEDCLVIEVADDDAGGWAAGRYRLQAGPDGASCTREAATSADLTIHQRGLAGLYLGGRPMRTVQVAELVDEHTSGAAARLGAMLGSAVEPWNATPF